MLEKNKIVGIQGIDTRMITRIIRDEGAMNGAISSEGLSNQDLQSYLDTLPDMNGLDLAKSVSCDSPYLFNKALDKKYKIAAKGQGGMSIQGYHKRSSKACNSFRPGAHFGSLWA